MRVSAIRGAISVDKDDRSSMGEAVRELMLALERNNKIPLRNIISIQFTQTKDLVKTNAAGALRREFGDKYSQIPLFVSQEADIEGSPKGILRVMLLVNHRFRKRFKPQYLRDAMNLRPDLSNGRS